MYQADAFTDQPFKACSRFKLRWCTPIKEVRLRGHATLAAAAAIFKGEGNRSPTLHFDTVASGELTVSAAPDDKYCMELPASAVSEDVPEGAGVDSALMQEVVGGRARVERVPHCQVRACGATACACRTARCVHVARQPARAALPGPAELVVVLHESAGRAALEAIHPDAAALKRAYPGGQVLSIIVTAPGGGDGLDFLSRAFCPWAGIDEDPVTGCAHAVLAPYWRGRLGTGERPLRARQCSPLGGEMECDVAGDRVRLVSSAVVLRKGTLQL
ncbi:hypothetical protein WJX81_008305 [Elliptochloris bilobata]|uniref:Uncharacterized protein n=1 Tax=Elliptochloris bilobata TaxID=381761 RepID=A0AAW1QLC9_9CHLO